MKSMNRRLLHNPFLGELISEYWLPPTQRHEAQQHFLVGLDWNWSPPNSSSCSQHKFYRVLLSVCRYCLMTSRKTSWPFWLTLRFVSNLNLYLHWNLEGRGLWDNKSSKISIFYLIWSFEENLEWKEVLSENDQVWAKQIWNPPRVKTDLETFRTEKFDNLWIKE